MVRKLVIANPKGGIGRTTTVLNLGAALAEQGRRVLLIDLDPQAGLTASLGLELSAERRSSYSLLVHENIMLDQVTIHARGQMTLVPASKELLSLDSRLGTSRDAVGRLRNALAREELPFDYVLLDTAPTLGVTTANALFAADELLITVQTQYLAMRGVRDLLDTVQQMNQRLGADLKLAGIVATMYRPESLLAEDVVQEIHAVFPQEMFETVIPFSDVLAEAPASGQSVLEYAPDDPAAQAYRALAQEIMADE